MIVIQYFLSIIFIFLMYLSMTVFGLLGAIPAWLSRDATYWVIRNYCGTVIWLARVICGQKSQAVKQMMSGVNKGAGDTQLVIYPQGTRVAPGKSMPYKVGAAVICQRMERPCVMAATNVGIFWPKHSLLRKRGTAVFEYLDEVPADLELTDFVNYMEEAIESASDKLNIEAGFEKG